MTDQALAQDITDKLFQLNVALRQAATAGLDVELALPIISVRLPEGYPHPFLDQDGTVPCTVVQLESVTRRIR